ncbi:prolyl aminopeptidase [Candidatus Thiothrix sp. Deng01]|uniref:Proline iminopeptidase n=1 Tax=Candidatus Thiothrix phosphatis TaxID=3112415 RepID=A0ABU6CU57_9GAMM|nr:prolyl aminopeptidase [Candidatus Thiothrix sp. Deng01]MEB4590366.1 prolyl aminopeptidase [Candidatus Thiothrix sp. Deng01]
MTALYPPIRDNRHFYLQVDDVHEIYVEECGVAEGLPVVFLHGGPGSGCEPWHRQFFDPNRYRIILFDQRGCGRSRPHAVLERNTTWDLVADMELIREALGVDQWVLFGGSWGSTLALAYAEAHPERVCGMILRGIFLCRQQDIDWFYQLGQGVERIYPDYWQDYLAPIPDAERGDMVAAYYQRLTGDNEIARMQAAKAWSGWEGRCANLQPKEAVLSHFTDPYTAMSVARIEAHYFVNKGFFEPNQLLRDAHRIAHLPGSIIHGRYDMICPLEQAFALHEVWPNADFHIVSDSGHAASEVGIQQALVQATDDLLEHLE